MKLPILPLCLLLAGCNQNAPEEPKPALHSEANDSNPLPTLPPIIVEQPQPSLVETILQSANSHAQVSYLTNVDGVECTLKSPDPQDRLRVQEVVTRMFGSCKGTLEPPTVTFKFQPGPFYPQSMTGLHAAPVAVSDDVGSRLQQRWEYEKAKNAQEIHDLEAEIASDELALAGTVNRAFAYSQAEIIKAKKSRLEDLRTYYLNKYKENP